MITVRPELVTLKIKCKISKYREQKQNQCLLSTYYIPGTVLGFLKKQAGRKKI